MILFLNLLEAREEQGSDIILPSAIRLCCVPGMLAKIATRLPHTIHGKVGERERERESTLGHHTVEGFSLERMTRLDGGCSIGCPS